MSSISSLFALRMRWVLLTRFFLVFVLPSWHFLLSGRAEGREQPGRCHMPAESEQFVWFCSTRPVLFSPSLAVPLPGLQRAFGSSKSGAGEDGSSQPCSIYTPQIKITLSKHENTSIIFFLILAVSLKMPLCSRATLHNVCQLASAHGRM